MLSMARQRRRLNRLENSTTFCMGYTCKITEGAKVQFGRDRQHGKRFCIAAGSSEGCSADKGDRRGEFKEYTGDVSLLVLW